MIHSPRRRGGGQKCEVYEHRVFVYLLDGGPEGIRTLDLSDANRTRSRSGKFCARWMEISGGCMTGLDLQKGKLWYNEDNQI